MNALNFGLNDDYIYNPTINKMQYLIQRELEIDKEKKMNKSVFPDGIEFSNITFDLPKGMDWKNGDNINFKICLPKLEEKKMNKDKQIKELKETIEKAQKQVEQLENESNEDRWIGRSLTNENCFYLDSTEEKNNTRCIDYTKMPMIKVENDGINNNVLITYDVCQSEFLNVLTDHLKDARVGDKYNIYLHIEKAE
jgi:hypothetical protein